MIHKNGFSVYSLTGCYGHVRLYLLYSWPLCIFQSFNCASFIHFISFPKLDFSLKTNIDNYFLTIPIISVFFFYDSFEPECLVLNNGNLYALRISTNRLNKEKWSIIREHKQMYSKWLAFDYWLSFECFIGNRIVIILSFEFVLLIYELRCHVKLVTTQSTGNYEIL